MKRLSVLGHPLHAPFVHLPISLLPLSFAVQVWAVATGEVELRRLAEDGLVVGLLASGPAMLTGFLDLLSLPNGHAAERTAQAHFSTISLAVAFFFGAWLLGRERFAAPPWGALTCSAAGTLALLVGGWLGGQLVYRHGVGRD